jgi:hypothetical protein
MFVGRREKATKSWMIADPQYLNAGSPHGTGDSMH